MPDSVTLWTVVCQAPVSMGFSRQEYWSGFPYPPPGDLPNPGIKLMSLASPEVAGTFFTTSATCEALGHPFQLYFYFTSVRGQAVPKKSDSAGCSIRMQVGGKGKAFRLL